MQFFAMITTKQASRAGSTLASACTPLAATHNSADTDTTGVAMRVPRELLMHILQHCETPALLVVARTSRIMQAEAERLLYECVEVQGTDAYLHRVLTILEDVQWGGSRRADAVRCLALASPTGAHIQASQIHTAIPSPLAAFCNLDTVQLGAFYRWDTAYMGNDNNRYVIDALCAPNPPFALRTLVVSSTNDLMQLTRLLATHLTLRVRYEAGTSGGCPPLALCPLPQVRLYGRHTSIPTDLTLPAGEPVFLCSLHPTHLPSITI